MNACALHCVLLLRKMLQDEQNRLLDERAMEEDLDHCAQRVSLAGRWSLEHALRSTGVTDSAVERTPCSGRLDGALSATTRPVHWELDYELGSKVGGGMMGGRRECLPRWDSGSKPLHEWAPSPTDSKQRPQEEVRLLASAYSKDGGASAGRWPAAEYVGARMEMLGKEVAAAATCDSSRLRKLVGRQQQTSVPLMPDHYNSEPASAATHRQEHVAVNGRGKKLGPYGPSGGPPAQPPPPPPNILV